MVGEGIQAEECRKWAFTEPGPFPMAGAPGMKHDEGRKAHVLACLNTRMRQWLRSELYTVAIFFFSSVWQNRNSIYLNLIIQSCVIKATQGGLWMLPGRRRTWGLPWEHRLFHVVSGQVKEVKSAMLLPLLLVATEGIGQVHTSSPRLEWPGEEVGAHRGF